MTVGSALPSPPARRAGLGRDLAELLFVALDQLRQRHRQSLGVRVRVRLSGSRRDRLLTLQAAQKEFQPETIYVNTASVGLPPERLRHDLLERGFGGFVARY